MIGALSSPCGRAHGRPTVKLLASEAVADKQTKRPGCGRGRGAAFCDMAFICRQCITAGIRGIHQQAVYYVMPCHDDHIACIEPRGIEGGNKSLFARHRRASVVVQGRTAKLKSACQCPAWSHSAINDLFSGSRRWRSVLRSAASYSGCFPCVAARGAASDSLRLAVAGNALKPKSHASTLAEEVCFFLRSFGPLCM